MTDEALVCEIPRCSPLVRALGTDPVGSAPGRTSFVVVEHPLPWPKDLSEAPELAPLYAAVERRRSAGDPWRVQGLVPDGDSSGRVILYRLPSGPFDRYQRFEMTGDASSIAALLDDPDAAGFDDGGEDFLLCTHGRRDICCGSDGTALWKSFGPGPLRRTSHTGGHRFAPTGIHLPSGTCWGWLDETVLGHVLARDVAFQELSGHYRGSTALQSGHAQVVERVAFSEVGWEWLDWKRQAMVEASDGAAVVTLTATSPSGVASRWIGRTMTVGTTPVPACGQPVGVGGKEEPDIRLSSLERA